MAASRIPSRLEQAARDFPALYPFGTNLTKFLDAEEEKTASFEERLRSAWRYLAGRVNRFSATLKPRESAVFDVEDVVNSVVERLVEKDHLWDPARGRYSTFVEAVMMSVLATCHERARTVTGPTNSFARLKTYHEREADGTLTLSMKETMDRLERAMGDYETIDSRHFETNGHDDVDSILLRKALRTFDDPIQVWVIVRKSGILGMEPMTMKAIAETLGISEKDVRKINRSARKKLKECLKFYKEEEADEAL